MASALEPTPGTTILDTTVLVDAERHGPMVLDHLMEDEDDVAIAAISVAELSVGVELAIRWSVDQAGRRSSPAYWIVSRSRLRR